MLARSPSKYFPPWPLLCIFYYSHFLLQSFSTWPCCPQGKLQSLEPGWGVVYLLAALHLGGIKGHLKVADKGWVAAQGGWGNLASLRLPSFVVQDPLKELSSTLSFEQRNTYIFFVEEVEEVLWFKLLQLVRPQSDLHININIKYVISLSKYTGKLVSFFICLHWCRLCTFCH